MKGVDSLGVIELDREDFLNPEQPVNAVTLSTSSLAKTSPTEPIYEIELPAPVDLDGVITASAVVLPISLVIHSPPHRTVTGEAEVVIRRESDGGPGEYPYSGGRTMAAPVDVAVALPPLQPDSYELEVSVPGATQVKQRFAVEPGAQMLEVKLSAGSDVRVEFVEPNGVRNRVHDRLFSDSQPVPRYSDEGGTYRGLPRAITRSASKDLRKRPS